VVANPNPMCGGPCGFENPLAQQDVRLRGNGVGIGFTVGVLVRPVERLWIGVSYLSHSAAGDVALSDNTLARVRLAPDGAPGSALLGGDDRVVTLLPEMVQAGLRVNVSSKLDVEASFRFVHWGARTALDVSLQGGELAAAKIAPELLIDRGLQNSYAVEVSTRHVVSPSLRLSPSLVFETSAIAPSAVSAAALDAPKLDAALTLEWTPWRGAGNHALTLGTHVAGTAYILGRVDSRYSSQAEVACVDSGYALGSCGALDAGSAQPSASGSYTLFVVSFGGSLMFSY
jgi:long-subunit fatty acid transport protein